jgi:prepilin-type processing-associated H-X9-DG protein
MVGFDNDTYRSAWDIGGKNPNAMKDAPGTTVINGSDLNTSGLGRNLWGSAHSSTFNMVFCDGSVHGIPYSVDVNVHRSLAARNDGKDLKYDF